MLTFTMFLLMTFIPAFKSTFMLIFNIKVLHMLSFYIICIGIDVMCLFTIYAFAMKAFEEYRHE